MQGPAPGRLEDLFAAAEDVRDLQVLAATPQQPDSGCSTSSPRRFKISSSSLKPIAAAHVAYGAVLGAFYVLGGAGR